MREPNPEQEQSAAEFINEQIGKAASQAENAEKSGRNSLLVSLGGTAIGLGGSILMSSSGEISETTQQIISYGGVTVGMGAIINCFRKGILGNRFSERISTLKNYRDNHNKFTEEYEKFAEEEYTVDSRAELSVAIEPENIEVAEAEAQPEEENKEQESIEEKIQEVIKSRRGNRYVITQLTAASVFIGIQALDGAFENNGKDLLSFTKSNNFDDTSLIIMGAMASLLQAATILNASVIETLDSGEIFELQTRAMMKEHAQRLRTEAKAS